MRIRLQDDEGYVLDQEVTIDLLLKEHGLESANGVRVPIGEDCYEDNDQDAEPLNTETGSGEASIKAFQSLVGSLLWIARCT